MNKERLTILRDTLIAYAKRPGNLKFDLEYWVRVKRGYIMRPELDRIAARAKRGMNYCGTTACACGLATTIPAFRAAGLRISRPTMGSDGGTALVFKGLRNWDAVKVFFSLDLRDAEELFNQEYYDVRDRRDPLAVADRITALLECTD